MALSRARLGLYILGRRAVFESCYELRDATELLFERPDKLRLTVGELYPTERTLEDEPEGTDMEGVEHLGQYVYEMTQAKIKALSATNGSLPVPVNETAEVDMTASDDEPEEVDAADVGDED